jgi:hypothetical protein
MALHTTGLLILHEQGTTMHAGSFAIASLLSGRKPACAGNAKTGARQHGRGRFHLLLPAVGVTIQRQASAGGEQLGHYSPSWAYRSLSMTAVLSIHGNKRRALAVTYCSTSARGIQDLVVLVTCRNPQRVWLRWRTRVQARLAGLEDGGRTRPPRLDITRRSHALMS